MKKYVELPLSELKEGITILKNHGFMYTIESIEKISENIRLVSLSDRNGNTITEYATDDKMYYVRTEHLDESDRLAHSPFGRRERPHPTYWFDQQRKKHDERVAARQEKKNEEPKPEPTTRIGKAVRAVKRAVKWLDDRSQGLHDSYTVEDWQEVNRKDNTDGLSKKAVNAYRRENPGSKLQTAVTEKNPKGKRASRRKSFCSRMSGMKRRLTSAKTARDPDSRINKALRRWRCNSSYEPQGTMIAESEDIIKKLAKKHDVSEEQIEKQLEMGMEIEKEHTDNPAEARKIAIDHLEEKPDYYTKLKKYVEGDMDSGEGKVTEGKIYDRLVQQLRDKGTPLNRAHAIATAQLQKSGVLKRGTRKLTKKGKKRQAMGAAGRAKDRAAKRSGRKTSDYKYDPKSNIATLKNSYEPQGNMLEEGENKPTNPEAWADCISQAKSKFKVYPSAYANGWASKCYKKKGGGWKKAK